MATDQTSSKQLTLANLFSTCVECFGLVHGDKNWSRTEHLELTKLGIQQGRLLAWGDVVGICEADEQRDARLDEPDTRDKVEAALQAIIDRPAHTDRVTQFEQYGLKPPKKFSPGFEPALDFNRLEAFREKLYYMRERIKKGEPRRGKSATMVHWQIVDALKFQDFVKLIRDNVDVLVELMGVRERVDMAMRHDIRAFGWHPVFERARASRDMSKLKMIRDVCKDEYPGYATAAEIALAQLDKEWNDNYEAVMERQATTSEIPFAASKLIAKSTESKDHDKRGSWFSHLKPKAWRKNSKHHLEVQSPATEGGTEGDPQRSKSLGHHEEDDDDDPLTHARSKSISVMPMSAAEPPKESVIEESKEQDQLSRVDTAKSIAKMNLEPVTSMISRHDQWNTHRASIA
ncbi:hypothetical protein NA57DRAFT_70812 [Rhizodiscina lignyota]|uniref:Prion-inhibition and propagation HeLo domain-containing protein n=1 Tax=Rhizodiscina lignyota TaxID=1504668 RepID=A0A9P4MBF7_9PEZI|nr:hypothetical protein NA57DRAFT_70812 [Rhizodiscina lignyota]